MIIQTLNPILIVSAKLHCLCTILDNSFPMRICTEEDKFSEQQFSLKGGGDGRGGNGAKVFASLFHFWCYNYFTIFSL